MRAEFGKQSERPATKEDIRNRKRFEVIRALENFQKRAVTPVELHFLKKKGLVPHTGSRFRRHK